MIKAIDIYNPNAKTALFINQSNHETITVSLHPYALADQYCSPEIFTNAGCAYVYLLEGFGLCGAVGSEEPLKFDKLL